MKHIVVPLDGTRASEVALPYAVALAKRANSRLTLVRAAQAPPLETDAARGEAERVLVAHTYLDQLAHELSSTSDVAVDTGVPVGDAAGWIVAEVALRQADLVVMSTHDPGGPRRWVLGSVAESVVRYAQVPVLMVRADQGVLAADVLLKSQRTIVVPLDGSVLAESALPLAIELAQILSAQIVLVGVTPPPGDPVIGASSLGAYVGDQFADLSAQTERYLQRTRTRFSTGGVDLETLLVRGDAATEIVRVARRTAAAAVVMTTHGRTGLARAIVGSVAGAVVHDGPSPVLLVRPAHLLVEPEQLEDSRCSTTSSSHSTARP